MREHGRYGRRERLLRRRGGAVVGGCLLAFAALVSGSAGAQDAGPGRDEPGAALIIEEDTGLWALFWKGGYVMPLILAASVVALGFAIERGVSLRSSVQIPEKLADRVADDFARGGVGAAMPRVKGKDATLARMLEAVLTRASDGRRGMEDAALAAASYSLYEMRRNIRPLAIVAGIAPLLGLLGTVWGMIKAFDRVSLGGLGRSAELAGGIAEALLTTGAGLLVAIPALIAYHYYRGRSEDIVRRSEAQTVVLMEKVLAANDDVEDAEEG